MNFQLCFMPMKALSSFTSSSETHGWFRCVHFSIMDWDWWKVHVRIEISRGFPTMPFPLLHVWWKQTLKYVYEIKKISEVPYFFTFIYSSNIKSKNWNWKRDKTYRGKTFLTWDRLKNATELKYFVVATTLLPFFKNKNGRCGQILHN